MSRYPLGQPVTVPVTVRQRNADGTYSLVDSTPVTVVKLAQADGTLLTTGTYNAPAHDGLGLYHQDIPAADLTTAGHYQWAATTTGTGAGVAFGDFDVFDPFETAVLPLADAKDALNIPQAVTSSDAEIQSYIATIESNLERATGGPLVNRSVTERAEAVSGMTALCLRQRPVVAVQSITSESSGGALSLADIKVDVNAGIVRRALGLPFYGPFFAWQPWFTVTYTAGWGTSVPAAFSSFARIVIQHLWTSQHGPAARPSIGGEEMVTIPGFGFAVPNMAAELLNGSQGGVPFLSEAYV